MIISNISLLVNHLFFISFYIIIFCTQIQINDVTDVYMFYMFRRFLGEPQRCRIRDNNILLILILYKFYLLRKTNPWLSRYSSNVNFYSCFTGQPLRMQSLIHHQSSTLICLGLFVCGINRQYLVYVNAAKYARIYLSINKTRGSINTSP